MCFSIFEWYQNKKPVDQSEEIQVKDHAGTLKNLEDALGIDTTRNPKDAQETSNINDL